MATGRTLSRRTVLAASLAPSLAPSLAMKAPAAPVRLQRKVKLVMAGFQGHAGEILDPLPQLPDVQLAAVCESDAKALTRAARNPHVASARKYGRLTEMLDQERPDLVAVCNNNGERAAAVLECARRRIPVIAEKPLAINLQDYLEVRRTVEAQKVPLGLLLPMRFDPSYLALRRIVEEGLIGEVIQVSSQKSYKTGTEEWRHRKATYGSTILWIGIHMIDLMRWTSGREFLDATGWQTRVGFPEIGEQENVSASVYQLDNGGLAMLRMDYLRPKSAASHGDDRLRLAGTKGVAEFMHSTGVTLITDKDGARNITDLPPAGSVFIDFLQGAFGGGTSSVTLPDIWKVNEITLAAHLSSTRGAARVPVATLLSRGR